MEPAVFTNVEFNTGFHVVLPRGAVIAAKIAGASYEFEITVRSRVTFAKMGFSPQRSHDFIDALKTRRAATFTGQTVHDTFVWGDKIIITPKDGGKVELRVSDCGNPFATITLASDAVDHLVASLEALWATTPVDVTRLLERLNETNERFWGAYPSLRAELDTMLAEKRFALATETYYRTHHKWFAEVREPEIKGKPLTEGRRRAIEAVLAALDGDN